MKLFFVAIASATISAIVFSAGVYQMTRAKWHELGVYSGAISGKANTLAEICKYSKHGKPPAKVDFFIDSKAARVSFVKQHDGFQIYCE
jgi:hypothetical protein